MSFLQQKTNLSNTKREKSEAKAVVSARSPDFACLHAVGFNAIIVLWVRSRSESQRVPVWSGHHSKISIWAAETRTQPYSSFTSDTFHCKRQIEKRKSETGEKKKIKQKLGLGWLENVNVLEISQHVKQTKRGNYVGIVSRWFYRSSCWKRGKQAFQELSALIFSLFACVGRSKMGVNRVLLSSSVVTVIRLFRRSGFLWSISGEIYFSMTVVWSLDRV